MRVYIYIYTAAVGPGAARQWAKSPPSQPKSAPQ